MAQEEQVLVVERKILEQAGLFQGLTFDVERYLGKLLVRGAAHFMPRSRAEEDPAYKQLIPYVLMTHGGKYLSYVRGKRAGESRLVGHRSIGIGGHVNPVDEMPLLEVDFRAAYFAAVEREVAEEVLLEDGHSEQVVALLNDDSTEVGRVHLGIVHLWTLASSNVKKQEQMITQLAFVSPAELQEARESLETWSRLCLDNLDELTQRRQDGTRFRPVQEIP